MHIIHKLIEKIKGKPKVYRIELSIGNQLSDGDRAAIYGWPDYLVRDVEYESD